MQTAEDTHVQQQSGQYKHRGIGAFEGMHFSGQVQKKFTATMQGQKSLGQEIFSSIFERRRNQ